MINLITRQTTGNRGWQDHGCMYGHELVKDLPTELHGLRRTDRALAELATGHTTLLVTNSETITPKHEVLLIAFDFRVNKSSPSEG